MKKESAQETQIRIANALEKATRQNEVLLRLNEHHLQLGKVSIEMALLNSKYNMDKNSQTERISKLIEMVKTLDKEKD